MDIIDVLLAKGGGGGVSVTSLWTGTLYYNQNVTFTENIFQENKIYIFKFSNSANDGLKIGFVLGKDILSGDKFFVSGGAGQDSSQWQQLTYNKDTFVLTYNNGGNYAYVVEILQLG